MMTNREHIDRLSKHLQELENLVAGVRETELCPVSFFSQAYRSAHQFVEALHLLEVSQVEMLKQQMEEHRRLIEAMPRREVPASRPSTESSAYFPSKEKEKDPDEMNMAGHPAAPVPPVGEKPLEKQEKRPAERTAEHISVQAVPGVFINERPAVSLNEILEKRQLSDFRKALSLNDRFRFRRELFGGDEARMNETLAILNDLTAYETSVLYLQNELKWNIEDPAVVDFLHLLEKRFS